MRGLAVLALACAACSIPPQNDEGKVCSRDDLCGRDWTCLIRAGADAGVCHQTPCDFVDAGAPCASVCGAGTLTCAPPTAAVVSEGELLVCSGCGAVQVTVSPPDAGVAPVGAQRFTAAVSGAVDQSVTWSVDEGASGGSISAAGDYTGPCLPGTYHVRARSNAVSTASGVAEVRVSAPSGTLDKCFNATGRLVSAVNTSGYDEVHGLALQPDGFIVTCGSSLNGANGLDAVVSRYDESGGLDPTFGPTGGHVTFGTTNPERARACAVMPDGGILVAGYANTRLALWRFTHTGVADATFGSGGAVSTQWSAGSDQAWSVLVASDGSIFVAGDSSTGSTLVEHFSASGVFDTTFGSAGYFVEHFDGGASMRSIVELSGGNVAIGGMETSNGKRSAFIRALTSKGAPLAGFGTNGLAELAPSNDTGAWWLALDPAGRLVLGGDTSPDGTEASRDFFAARFTASGVPDPTFGGAGWSRINGGVGDTAFGVAVQADGKVVTAGVATISGVDRYTLARWNADGGPDTSFGNNGVVVESFSANCAHAIAVVVQPDGRILSGGNSATGACGGNNYDLAMARYLP